MVTAVTCTKSKKPNQKACTPELDNFEKDVDRFMKRQKRRSEHKALAYATEDPTGCLAVEHSYGKPTREAAIDAALSFCREYNTDQMYGPCTVYSVDGKCEDH